MKKQNRLQIDKDTISGVMITLQKKLDSKIEKRGMNSYASIHEIYGIIAEEFKEVMDEMHLNRYADFESELIDVAVGALWGVMSMRTLRENEVYKY